MTCHSIPEVSYAHCTIGAGVEWECTTPSPWPCMQALHNTRIPKLTVTGEGEEMESEVCTCNRKQTRHSLVGFRPDTSGITKHGRETTEKAIVTVMGTHGVSCSATTSRILF